MTNAKDKQLLTDHVDMRLVTDNVSSFADRNRIVQLSPDHPGFKDSLYRDRRNEIARIALEYQPGSPIPDAPYTKQEHLVWQKICEELKPAHEKYACGEYLKSLERLNLDVRRIPQLSEVSRKIETLSGFRLEPVAGLVEPRVFLEALAGGVFLCTQYIRHHSTPLYTPEPDVAHEIIGHAVTLASPRLAKLNRLFGEAVTRSSSSEELDRLSRVYWFTIEFGVLMEDDTVKAYGTGLLSSAGELTQLDQADLQPLDLEKASHEVYDPTHFQATLFCAQSFDQMYDLLSNFLISFKGGAGS